MKTAASGRVALTQDLILILLSVGPCVLAFGRAVWPLYALWVALGSVRVRYGDRKVLQDCLYLGVLSCLSFRERIVKKIVPIWGTLANHRATSLAYGSVAILVVLALVSYLFLKNDYDRGIEDEFFPKGKRSWTLQHPKPFIIPCRTTHTRIFPRRHAFGYNYLLCGFPIIPGGITPDGMELPDGKDKCLGRWWLRIHADDYLIRGVADLGFYGKLKVFLREKVCVLALRVCQQLNK